MKQKITILLSTIATFLTLGAVSSFASDVAVLDIEKIGKESKAVLDIQAKVVKKQEEFRKEITKKQTSLQSDQKKLEAKKNILSKEAFEKEQREFEKKIDSLNELVEKRQNTLKKAQEDSTTKVNDKMKEIITEIAKEKQLSLIIPASQTVFSADNLDISNEVIEKLNKKITKVDVKFD